MTEAELTSMDLIPIPKCTFSDLNAENTYFCHGRTGNSVPNVSFQKLGIYLKFVRWQPVISIMFLLATLVYIYRGYYTAARRYDFYLRVVKTIFYERAQRVSKSKYMYKMYIYRYITINYHPSSMIYCPSKQST
jgi:hypothetical protein